MDLSKLYKQQRNEALSRWACFAALTDRQVQELGAALGMLLEARGVETPAKPTAEQLIALAEESMGRLVESWDGWIGNIDPPDLQVFDPESGRVRTLRWSMNLDERTGPPSASDVPGYGFLEEKILPARTE